MVQYKRCLKVFVCRLALATLAVCSRFAFNMTTLMVSQHGTCSRYVTMDHGC